MSSLNEPGCGDTIQIERAWRLGGSLLCIGLLVACTVGPDYHRPDPPVTAAYTGPNPDKAPDQAPGNSQGSGPEPAQQIAPKVAWGQNPATDWWSVLGSSELDATMRQALSGNFSVAEALAKLAQARETVNATAGGLYPQLSVDAGAGRQKYGAEFSGAQTVPPFTYFALGPSVSYALDYTGGQRRAVEEQQAQADYQAFQLQAVYLSITGGVAQQVLAIASTRAQIAAVEALLAEDQQNLDLVQTSFDAGSGTRVDVLNAQSQLANDQTLPPPLHQQLSVARHALAILVGQAPADWTPPDFDLADLQLPETLPLSLPSELAHRRPDILAAESQLHAATAAVGVATAQLYPQIALTASLGQQSTQLSHLFDGSSNVWGLVAALTAPVFDGGTLRAERRGAEDAMRAALAHYQETILQSFGQVADVLTALDHDAEQLRAQKNALDTAAASLALTRQSYTVGNVGVLQVLDAQRLYLQARLGYVRAQSQRELDTVQLFLALGGSGPA